MQAANARESKTFRSLLTPLSAAKYLCWRAAGASRPIRLNLAETGGVLTLREWEHNDYATAYEIFVHECYRPMARRSPHDYRTIVDLGANVGFSCLYLSRMFPRAHIYAFEPHPVHYRHLAENVKNNGLSDRVTLYEAAAGTSPGKAYITDSDRQSHLVGQEQTSAFPVQIVDLYECLGALPGIDFLKMDIEGGEYQVLADARFPALGVRELVMEWHSTPEISDGKRWCEERLGSLSYTLEIREDEGSYGTLAAVRS